MSSNQGFDASDALAPPETKTSLNSSAAPLTSLVSAYFVGTSLSISTK